MADIGDVLKRRRKLGDARDTIRLVGVSAAGYVAAPVEHGEPFVITTDQLVSEYASRAPSLPPSEAEILAQRDRETTVAATRAYGRARRGRRPAAPPPRPAAGSPEHFFEQQSNDDGDSSDG